MCDQFEKEFDLKIPFPFHPMLAVLNRCVRQRVLERISDGYNINEQVAKNLIYRPIEIN